MGDTTEDGIEMSRKYRDRIIDDEEDEDDEEEESSSSGTSSGDDDPYELPFPAGHSRHNNKNNHSTERHRRCGGCSIYVVILTILVVVLGFTYYVSLPNLSVDDSSDHPNHPQPQTPIEESSSCALPVSLLDKGVYDISKDFVNELGITPPYWGTQQQQQQQQQDDSSSSETHWGPCFVDDSIKASSWKDQRNDDNDKNNHNIKFEYLHNPNDPKWPGPTRQDGTCRPGFIIIGAGKCGTSSLYHYLMGHPRVAPAYEKQIHYFIVRTVHRDRVYYDMHQVPNVFVY